MENQLTMRLPAELAAKLARSAKQQKRKRSEVVRAALEQYLNTEPNVRPIEQVRDLSVASPADDPTWVSATAIILSVGCAVVDELLLDTGAFVALIDRDEKFHGACVDALERWSGPVVTTEAVLTETLYLAGPQWRGQKVCLEFILRVSSKWFPRRWRVCNGCGR